MNVHTSPHPSSKSCADTVSTRHAHGRPRQELVPSRCALKVGDIEVTVVSDGVLSLPGAMLGHNAEPVDTLVYASLRAVLGPRRPVDGRTTAVEAAM